jgi:hypothetical protein
MARWTGDWDESGPELADCLGFYVNPRLSASLGQTGRPMFEKQAFGPILASSRRPMEPGSLPHHFAHSATMGRPFWPRLADGLGLT